VKTLRDNAAAISALSLVGAIIAIVVIAAISGASLHHIFDHINAGWIVVVAAAELASFLVYMVAYRQLTVINGQQAPKLSIVIAVVLAGFGPFVTGGGFSLDRKVLESVYDSRETARVQVIALVALEWAVLAPLVWLAAVIMLITGAHAEGGLPWYWAIGVLLGFAAGLWITRPEHSLAWLRRFASLAGLIEGIRTIHTILRNPVGTSPAWLPMLLYWLLELAALYAALRLFGIHLGVVRTTLAYGTGYVVTRRSLPLAGAVVTEVLLPLALHWVGAPLGPALAAVVVYRACNLALASGPSWLAGRRLTHQLDLGSI
jgi:uncharacterized membrane protein YbhN (UPF0104 family)